MSEAFDCLIRLVSDWPETKKEKERQVEDGQRHCQSWIHCDGLKAGEKEMWEQLERGGKAGPCKEEGEGEEMLACGRVSQKSQLSDRSILRTSLLSVGCFICSVNLSDTALEVSPPYPLATHIALPRRRSSVLTLWIPSFLALIRASAHPLEGA